MTRLLALVLVAAVAPKGMVRVPAGTYQPFFRDTPSPAAKQPAPEPSPVPVPAFLLDEAPVTNDAFLAFVRAHPEWRRSRTPRIFADAGYLRSWAGDLEPGPRNPRRAPVTEVSWFAARAYCRAQGKRLPTGAEWEYAASAPAEQRAETSDRILAWYGKPTPERLSEVAQSPANRFGLFDLHALVWEWTLDFNDTMLADDTRKDPGGDTSLYCGSGGAKAIDPSDYATFMRHAFRSSLKAPYTVRNLGFRCARDAK